jgi:hypothetical protein
MPKDRALRQMFIVTLNRKRGFFVTFEVFTTVSIMNAVFWDVRPCGS